MKEVPSFNLVGEGNLIVKEAQTMSFQVLFKTIFGIWISSM
jgi:hypothetical protein